MIKFYNIVSVWRCIGDLMGIKRFFGVLFESYEGLGGRACPFYI